MKSILSATAAVALLALGGCVGAGQSPDAIRERIWTESQQRRAIDNARVANAQAEYDEARAKCIADAEARLKPRADALTAAIQLCRMGL
jgi:hypothetical protein